MKTFPIAAFAMLAAAWACAETPSGVWRTKDGAVVAESSARRSVDGLGVWLVVTPDENWAEKWNTPSHVVPTFSEASEVRRGGKLFILTFIGNPKPDQKNRLNVVCDLQVKRPDGSTSTDAKNVTCLDGPLLGESRNLRLSSLAAGFSADPGDLAGKWEVTVKVRDLNRSLEIPVSTAFTLVEK